MSNKRKNGSDTPLWIRVICGILGVLMVLGVVMMALPYMGQSMAYAAELTTLSDTGNDAMIRVGLHAKSEAVTAFTVQSDGGFEMAYRISDTQTEKLLEYPQGELTVAIDGSLYRYGSGLTSENLGIAAIGGYHVEISYFTFSELGIDDRDNPVYIEPGSTSSITDGYTRDSVNDHIELLATSNTVKQLEQPIFPYYTANKTYIRLGSYYTQEAAENALALLEREMTLNAKVVSADQNVLTVLDSTMWLPVCELSTERYMLCLSPKDDNAFTDSASRIYHGSILYNRADPSYGGKMQVINRFSLEEYVAALLSYEVSANEDEELLKAMSIILRTEAVRHLNTHKADGYDVCSDSHCHRFSGSTVVATAIRKAVLETSGKILTYDGKPIYTPYSVETGGSTISAESAFGKDIAYLPSQITPWEDMSENTNERWHVELLPYELYILVTDAGYSEIKGNIQSVEILKTAEGSDYVSELSFTDIMGNSITVSGSEQIRVLFEGLLPSANFVVGKAGDEVTVVKRTLIGDGLDYTEESETIRLEGRFDCFVFSGRGSGTGVGMSLEGARVLSSMGYTFDQILAIYYPDTKIEDT